MDKYKCLFSTVLFCLSMLTVYSQVKRPHGTFIISGMIYDRHTLECIPFVNVSINEKKVELSDQTGHFEVATTLWDTLTITRFGYETVVVSLKDATVTNDTMYLDVLMNTKPIEMPEAKILPFANYEQFKTALINLHTTNTKATQNADKNIKILKSQINGNFIMEMDGLSVYKNMMIMKDQNNNAFIFLSSDPHKGGLYGIVHSIITNGK